MFEDYSLIHTVKRGLGNRYGVIGGSIKFGYFPDRTQRRNFRVADLAAEFGRVLKPMRSSLETLPRKVRKAFQLPDGFSLVTGVGPKGYEKRLPVQQLVTALQEHPQMIQTLELCDVYVLVNGEPFDGGKSLALPRIAPLAGAEKPREIPIPSSLKDPVTDEKISTTNDDSLPAGTLIPRTSDSEHAV